MTKIKQWWNSFLSHAPRWKAALVSTLNSLLGFGLGLSALVAGLNQIEVNGAPLVSVPADVIAGLTIAISILRTLVAAINPFDPTFGFGSGGVDDNENPPSDTPEATDNDGEPSAGTTDSVVVVDAGPGTTEEVPLDEVDEPDSPEDGPELVLEDAPDDAFTENDVDLRLS
jgi:hypothetical protein